MFEAKWGFFIQQKFDCITQYEQTEKQRNGRRKTNGYCENAKFKR